jgi:hypothetical protein
VEPLSRVEDRGGHDPAQLQRRQRRGHDIGHTAA